MSQTRVLPPSREEVATPRRHRDTAPGAGLSGLSPSRAGDFMTCPLLFRFRTLDRLPEPPSAAAARGTLVHSVLERLFDLEADERLPEQAVDLLRPAWADLVAAEPDLAALVGGDDPAALDAWIAGATPLVERYFKLEDPTRLEPADRELYVVAPARRGAATAPAGVPRQRRGRAIRAGRGRPARDRAQDPGAVGGNPARVRHR